MSSCVVGHERRANTAHVGIWVVSRHGCKSSANDFVMLDFCEQGIQKPRNDHPKNKVAKTTTVTVQ